MQKDHPKVEYGKTGVLLINLGTPDSTIGDKKIFKNFYPIELKKLIHLYANNFKFIYIYSDHLKTHAYKRFEKKQIVPTSVLYKKSS